MDKLGLQEFLFSKWEKNNCDLYHTGYHFIGSYPNMMLIELVCRMFPVHKCTFGDGMHTFGSSLLHMFLYDRLVPIA
jgi:hypothetical protein